MLLQQLAEASGVAAVAWLRAGTGGGSAHDGIPVHFSLVMMLPALSRALFRGLPPDQSE